MQFQGSELRLARTFNGFSLDELGDLVGKTRQYLHKCEVGQAEPTAELLTDLAKALRVQPTFFLDTPKATLSEEQFHFRKLFTTKALLKQVVMARGEMFGRLADQLDAELKLPAVAIPDFGTAKTVDAIERAADNCRRHWALGMGPIADMNRLAEHLGVLITSFQSLSTEIDALSVASSRPIIVRNEAKASVCRQRFDIGHELGHLVLHTGVATGDRETESHANRFASALLVPQAMMVKLFPKPRTSRLDWQALSEFKLTWKISKAALLYRARQLSLISEDQYKTGAITLRRTGEAVGEKEDYRIPYEGPELLATSFDVLAQKKGMTAVMIANALKVQPEFLHELVGPKVTRQLKPNLKLV